MELIEGATLAPGLQTAESQAAQRRGGRARHLEGGGEHKL